MFALIENGTVKKYPYTEHDVRRANPQTSLPAVFSDVVMASFGAQRVFFSTPPAYNENTHALEEGLPIFDQEAQRWAQVWSVRDLSADEKSRRANAVQQMIVDAVQQRLDDFARTRNYDSILSACTYATSAVPKFKAEGQCCVDARDNTWAVLYGYMAEVQAGTKPMPSGFSDVESLLPVLAWPA